MINCVGIVWKSERSARIGQAEYDRRTNQLTAPLHPTQAVSNSFDLAASLQAMQVSVTQQPLLKDTEFIQSFHETKYPEQILPGLISAYE